LLFQYITHVISRLLVFRLIISEVGIERKLVDFPCQNPRTQLINFSSALKTRSNSKKKSKKVKLNYWRGGAVVGKQKHGS